jgi:hypothetical protein
LINFKQIKKSIGKEKIREWIYEGIPKLPDKPSGYYIADHRDGIQSDDPLIENF